MKKALYVATVDIHIKSFHLPYLKLLHDKGYEVHVATNGDEIFPFCDVKHQICIERSPFKLSNIKAIKQLRKIINEEKFDIIHCHTPMGAVVTRLAAKKARKKYGTRVIYTAHGFHFYNGAPKLNWLLFYPIEKYLAKYTDTLITINKEDFELAKKDFFHRCQDIKYIPGVGIDTKKFKVKPENPEEKIIKKQLNLDEKCFVITCIARLDKNKNQGFLINMVNELIKKDSKYHLLLVGPDERNGYYKKLVDELNLNNNVHFLGRREDVANLLAISDVVVSASLREGLPVNIIEAFAAGKPVVALRCRGMEDLILNDDNGFIVDNEKQMMNRIIQIRNSNKQYDIINYDEARKYDTCRIIKLISDIYFRRKRILHLLASSSYSGAENVVCTIINNCDVSKYEMYYCSPNGKISEILKNKGINYIPINSLNYFELRKIVKKYNPDVIHAHDFKASFFSSLFSNNSMILSHLHKNDPNMKKITFKSILYNIVSHRFTYIIGVSKSIINEYVFSSKIKMRFITLSNFVDKEEIIKLSNKYNVNKKYDIFYLGRLSEEKNPLLFIEIIKSLNNPDIRAIVIGDGPLKEKCIKMVKGYNLENNIDFVGFLSNPYPYVHASKIGVLPSKYEGFGLSAIESLILGKYVLNSGVGGLAEIFQHNQEYICNDKNSYVEKIREILGNKHKLSVVDISNYTNNKLFSSTVMNIYEKGVNNND